MAKRLSQALLDKATSAQVIWDIKTTGLFCRVSTTKKSWGIHYRDRHGKQRKEIFGTYPEMTIEEAQDEARKKIEAANTEDPRNERVEVPDIQQGLDDCLMLSRGRQTTLDEYRRHSKRFVAWLKKKYPRVKLWSDLRPMMLEAYIRDMENDNLAFDSIRLRVTFVRSTWGRMAANYPTQVLPLGKIRLPKKPRVDIQCLTPAQVAKMLDWLKEHRESVYGMAVLQALAGLRMYEASSLRYQDVDLKAGTIAIVETPNHKPKNEYSERTIPVCGEVLTMLKEAMAGGDEKVQSISGEIFLNEVGEPYKPYALSQVWRRARNAISTKPKEIDRGATGTITVYKGGLNDPTFKNIAPRKLRAAFMTSASRLGAQDRVLKAYCGHAPEDILGRHYRQISIDELRAVSKLMDGWRALAKEQADKEESAL